MDPSSASRAKLLAQMLSCLLFAESIKPHILQPTMCTEKWGLHPSFQALDADPFLRAEV